MNLMLLGAPGSGKGTQAALLSKEYNIPSISTGDALRREVDNQSEIGNLAKSYMNSGKLVPDHVVVDIVASRLVQKDCENGFILDGFPRNISQAEQLEKINKIDLVVNFEVDEEVLVKRISGRFSCKKCGSVFNHYFSPTAKAGVCDNCGSTDFLSRSDDNEETVRSRLKVYHESTFPLIQFYQKNNLLVSIPSVKGAPLVFKALVEAIKSHQKK
jgi:adenylate kinase